ncbi:MAG: hypothetical protein Ct9H90mP7_0010 [Candidatus Neomarinimicrobiota bacterium]|nr:MAG: hypothetical protein Ct9H90mP7_0010 [Candidatus Neomarinimicrobiota bacterium]
MGGFNTFFHFFWGFLADLQHWLKPLKFIVVYVIIIEVFVYGDINWSSLKNIAAECGTLIGGVLFNTRSRDGFKTSFLVDPQNSNSPFRMGQIKYIIKIPLFINVKHFSTRDGVHDGHFLCYNNLSTFNCTYRCLFRHRSDSFGNYFHSKFRTGFF